MILKCVAVLFLLNLVLISCCREESGSAESGGSAVSGANETGSAGSDGGAVSGTNEAGSAENRPGSTAGGSGSSHGSARTATESEFYRFAEPYGGLPALVEGLCSLPETERLYAEAAEELDLPEGCVNISLLDETDRREMAAFIARELEEGTSTEREALLRRLQNWLIANRQLHILSHFGSTESLAAALFNQPRTTGLFDPLLASRSVDRDALDAEAVVVMMSSAEHENLLRDAATVISGESRQAQMHFFSTLYRELLE